MLDLGVKWLSAVDTVALGQRLAIDFERAHRSRGAALLRGSPIISSVWLVQHWNEAGRTHQKGKRPYKAEELWSSEGALERALLALSLASEWE